jgi:hypothetical protein
MTSEAEGECGRIFLQLKVCSEEDYRRLPRRDRYVFDLRWFDVEVKNGGLRQVFGNAIGDHWPGVMEALREIGEDSAAAMLEAGCSLFPEGRPSLDQEERGEQMTDPIIDALIELEDAQLDSYYRGDIHPKLLEYWHRHGPGHEEEERGDRASSMADQRTRTTTSGGNGDS